MKTKEEILAPYIEVPFRHTKIVEADNALKAMIELERQSLISFLEWFQKLNPSDKISLWSKSGEVSGVFNMDSEQIVDKFLAPTQQ